MQSIQVGDPYPFRPSAFMGDGHHRTAPLTGTVIAVNRAHRHFTVAARVNGHIIRETFKFAR